MSEFELGLLSAIIGGLSGAIVSAVNNYIVAKKNRESNEKLSKESELNKFRLSSMDKRLSVAQEAFTIWDRLRSVLHKNDERHKVCQEAEEWWYKNCLFLAPSVRLEYFKVIKYVSIYDTYKAIAHEKKDSTELEKIFSRIVNLSTLIENSVSIPTIEESEIRKGHPGALNEKT